MALTNVEKQRAFRERQKAKRIEQNRSSNGAMLQRYQEPFFRFFEERNDDWAMLFDIAGLETPEIDNDDDPSSHSGEIERLFQDEPERSPYAKKGGSLARGEIMVGCLIDAAAELARVINAYKRDEITARMAEIENTDLANPDTRKQALTETVRLQRMLDQLDKQVRWTFPQWKVTG